MKKVKLAKNVVQHRHDTVYCQYGFGSLDDFIDDLIKLRDSYAGYQQVTHHIDIEMDHWYDSVENVRLVIQSCRTETDEEVLAKKAEANRVRNEKARKQREKREKDEREQYERLKKKYEK